MRALGLLLLSTLLLAGCGRSTTDAVSGIDRSRMNPEVRPGDDFFAYANGKWLAETEIPADRSAWGSFAILQEQTLAQLNAIATLAAANAVVLLGVVLLIIVALNRLVDLRKEL